LVDKIVLFILIFLFAALVLSVIGSYILLYMNKADAEYEKKKKQVTNKIKCKQVELAYRKRLWNEYFWHKPMRFFWISGLFIIAIILAILPINLHNLYIDIVSIILAIIIFVAYIFFLKFAYDRYVNFERIAKEKLDQFEAPIRKAVNDLAKYTGDTIKQYSEKDEVLEKDFNYIFFIEQPKEVTKLEFPPFAPPLKRTIINTRKLEYLVFTNEYVCSYTNAWKFNLLKPERKPERNGCEEKTAGVLGPSSREHFYSDIAYGKFDGETFKIVYKTGEEFELITVYDRLPPDLKKKKNTIMAVLKYKLRITERQKLRKVDEYAKMEYIKKLRELSKENEQSEDKEEDSQEEKD